MIAELSALILDWYGKFGRVLPWRSNPRPYSVWVSEIMLQQTRVETVLPYYERWMQRFPAVPGLANAGLHEVLQIWEGLGYYSRARSLHKTAQILMLDHNGQLPDDPAALKRLPGIGPYTAAAILSIAFNRDIAAIDGNIRRVYSRLLDITAPLKTRENEHLVGRAARDHLPPGKAGDFNQALMDLGACICIPARPLCAECPVSAQCLARQRNVQEHRPVVIPREPIPSFLVVAAVIENNGAVLIARRPENGLLGGLWEFPGGKVEAGETFSSALSRELREELAVEITVGLPRGVYRHAYTHFRVELHAFSCKLISGLPRPLQASEIRWVELADLSNHPMGKIDRQISRRLQSGIE